VPEPAGSAPRWKVRVADAADLAAVHEVRERVFVREQGIAAELEWDAYDGPECGTVHLLAEGPDGPVGTVRMLTGDVAAAKNGGRRDEAVLGRLAVLAHERGTGLGAALVRALEEQARRRGSTGVYLEAQARVVPFYERLGYTASGPLFDDGTGIPHRAMRRALT
jgi:predicted GNAT family N-acyltransferase